MKALPPVSGKVRGHNLPFPFSIRRLVGGWKLLFLQSWLFEPDPSKSAQWNRGAYLVNGPGHCAECHSPRNFLGAIVEEERFAGGLSADRLGWVPNITSTAALVERRPGLVGKGHRKLSGRWNEPGWRFRRRGDGRRHPQHRSAQRG
jgi:mono/diheme cytochrome c family protein